MAAIYAFPLGAWRCVAISDNSRTTTLAATFIHLDPAALTAAGADPDAPITVGYNLLLVDTGSRRLLIDSGTGRGDLTAGLRQAGYEAEAIDGLLITHGDGDHVGGLDQFPNATIYLPTPAWDLWTEPAQRAGMVEEFLKLFQDRVPAAQLEQMAAGRARYGSEVLPGLGDRLQQVAPEQEFLPGIQFLPAQGHRSDHFAVRLQQGNATLLHLVDSLRHPLQAAHPDWTSYIDSHPQQMTAATRRLLNRAADEQALLFAAHLPFPGLGRVISAGDAWQWRPLH